MPRGAVIAATNGLSFDGGDGDVEYAFAAFPPQNILEQNASFGAILLERAAGIGSVGELLVRFGGRLSRDSADACGQ